MMHDFLFSHTFNYQQILKAVQLEFALLSSYGHIKVIWIVSRYALAESPLLHGNMKKETDTDIDKCIY